LGVESVPMPVSPARSAAFDILLRVERESSYASDLLHSAAYQRLSSADHALATELVMGALRWRSRLDDEIAGASSHPLSKLDVEILIALRLAVYQLRWLNRVPKHAALNESVVLVKRARKRSAAPFVNAVLRKLSATQNDRGLTQGEASSPDVLARDFAHPLWLVQRWVREYGLASARAICEYDQSVPSTAIRLRAPDAEAELNQAGISLAPAALIASARRVRSGDVAHTHAFDTGQIAIQGEASQLVAALAGGSLRAGATILDCCAAPGGKALAMADRRPGALITAVELYPHRARLLRKLLQHAHSGPRIQVVAGDARHLPVSAQFDRVLADVPCSGTGTLDRNPEIKWRLGPADLTNLGARQSEILSSAMARVRSPGCVVYSTCSLEKEENEDVVEQVLAENRSFRVRHCRKELDRLKADGELVWPDVTTLTRGPYLRTIPGVHPCDGFFAAILERE
jgi:16S rRNA (cytosine967-C5)-methyltransferase